MALKTRRTRSQVRRKYRLHKPPWRDPYPMIDGTEPEKRVFEWLMKYHIFFIFQGQIPEFEKGSPLYFLGPVGYKPDFVLPEYRLIIDPFSPFHHSLKGAAERDVDKVAKYNAAGYAYYHPWAVGPGQWTWDQYHTTINLEANKRLRKHYGVTGNDYSVNRQIKGRSMGTADMLSSIPEIGAGPRYQLEDPRDIKAKASPGYRLGQFLGAGANSVAAANKSRAIQKNPRLTTGSRRSIRRPR